MKKKSSWISSVKTTTVNTPTKVMTLPAETIVKTLLESNPNLPLGSIIKFIQFYLNRAGTNLSPKTKKEIERSKHIIQQMNKKQ